MTTTEMARHDIPSHIVREMEEGQRNRLAERYTLTYSEGKLSVYAGSSHRKYLVVQFA